MSYVSHAVFNNLPALLFVLLSRSYGLDEERLGRMVLINFATHLAVDFLALKLADKVGYRKCLVAGHFMGALGLALFGLLPVLLPSGLVYAGLCLSVAVFSFGGGMVQVLVSPIVNQISGHVKAGSMTLLHSFYPWGTMITVIFTTVALQFTPDHLWFVLPLAWTAVPLVTMHGFATAPMAEPRMSAQPSQPLKELARGRGLWLAAALMSFAGATECSMAQWSSYFIEAGLNLPKIAGDLAGPCVSALIMALIRMTYGKWEHKFPLERLLFCSALGSAASFAGMALIPSPVFALAACTFSGLTIAMMWPGGIHRGAKNFPLGGTGLFAMLALGGDFGCTVGPWLMGMVSKGTGNLHYGILTGALFPLGYLMVLLLDRRYRKDA